jgi:hypothetical protein
MKPCPHRQKDLALLAAGVLDASASRPLRQHLDECSACRQYWEELSLLCRSHVSATDRLPPPSAPEAFHQRLVERLKAPETARMRHAPRPLFAWLTCFPRKLAFAGLALALLVIAGLELRIKHPSQNPLPAIAKPKIMGTVDAPPSFLSYQLAANKSGAALDALLARNAAISPGPGLTVTASTRAVEGLTD